MPTGWSSLLRLLAASTSADTREGTHGLLLNIIAAHIGSGVTVSALEALEVTLRLVKRPATTLAMELSDSRGFNPTEVSSGRHLVRVLCDLADDADPAVQGATLKTLLAVVHCGTDLSVSELAAVALTSQALLTDFDAGVAEAARQLLAAVGMPAALLATSGVDIGNFQDVPAWRSQVSIIRMRALSATPCHA